MVLGSHLEEYSDLCISCVSAEDYVGRWMQSGTWSCGSCRYFLAAVSSRLLPAFCSCVVPGRSDASGTCGETWSSPRSLWRSDASCGVAAPLMWLRAECMLGLWPVCTFSSSQSCHLSKGADKCVPGGCPGRHLGELLGVLLWPGRLS